MVPQWRHWTADCTPGILNDLVKGLQILFKTDLACFPDLAAGFYHF